MKNRQEIDLWLKSNYRRLVKPEYCFGIDNNQCKVEDFDNADLRILVAFLSTGSTRAVSNTFNAISNQAMLGNEGIFIDYCYFPEQENIELFEANQIPYLFGNVSHAPVQDYDLVMVSHSIVPEVINIPRLLKGSNIPLTSNQRLEDNTIPLIAYGGAASNESSIALGPIYSEGKCIGRSLIDFAQYGYAEGVMNKYIAEIIKYKKQGIDPKTNKNELLNRMMDDKVCYGKLFYPLGYEWVYDEDNFTIKEIKKLDDRLPDRVDYNRITEEVVPTLGWMNKVFNLDGENATSVDIQCSSGCSGSCSVCSFCMEATVAGNYHEVPLDMMKEKMKWMKANCAPNSSSLYSYNINYYSHFMDIIKEQANMFSGISLLNERLDIVANAPEQLRLAKAVGLKRFSGAIEGFGERIRNGILNKNLSRETLMQACRVIYSLKLMHMKGGLILTGQEKQEDIDEFISEVDEMLAIKEEMGANTSLQFNITPLVFYSQIALRYLPRITAENSYNEVRNMQYFLSEMKKRNVRCKINGKGPGTYIEQLLLDFGPAGTDWLVGCVEDGLCYGRHFNKKDKQIVIDNLDKRGYDHLFFTFARPLDWIFPNDHIFYATDEVIQSWKDRTANMNFDTKLCLKTLANPNPKCHGCKMCYGEEGQVKFMTKRDMTDSATVDDILQSFTDTRIVDSTRIIFKIKPEWSLVSKTMLSHYITSKFLQINNDLVDKFHSNGRVSTFGVSKDGQSDWFGGVFDYEINWKSKISTGYLDKFIEQVNRSLDSCVVSKIVYNTKELASSSSDSFSYMGVITDIPITKIKDKMIDFDYQIKVATKAMGGLNLEKKSFPELKDKILFVPYKNQVLCYMTLPYGVNPYLVLSSIINKGYKYCMEISQFQLVDHTKEVDLTCRCGEPLTYSFVTDSVTKLCPTCMGRLRLKQATSR